MGEPAASETGVVHRRFGMHALAIGVAAALLALPLATMATTPPGMGQHAATPTAFETPLGQQTDTGYLAIARSDEQLRSDTFEIRIPSGDEAGHEVERKLRAVAGSTIAYAWRVEGIDNPEEFHADLHGHEPPAPGYREESFRKGGGLRDSGAFVVPFDGIHGWLFKNDSAVAATVVLQVSGFYEPVSEEELERIEEQAEALLGR